MRFHWNWPAEAGPARIEAERRRTVHAPRAFSRQILCAGPLSSKINALSESPSSKSQGRFVARPCTEICLGEGFPLNSCASPFGLKQPLSGLRSAGMLLLQTAAGHRAAREAFWCAWAPLPRRALLRELKDSLQAWRPVSRGASLPGAPCNFARVAWASIRWAAARGPCAHLRPTRAGDCRPD